MLQVHVKVALKPTVQGVGGTEECFGPHRVHWACNSLQLRGLAADSAFQRLRNMLCV